MIKPNFIRYAKRSRVFVPTWGHGTVEDYHDAPFFGTVGHWVRFDDVEESKLCKGTDLRPAAANG